MTKKLLKSMVDLRKKDEEITRIKTAQIPVNLKSLSLEIARQIT